MPEEPIEKIRPLLGRYGCTGEMQSQVMGQLSAGQKARIVFAIIAHEKPHLLLLDEPTNPVSTCLISPSIYFHNPILYIESLLLWIVVGYGIY